ncbi:hypothetical protein [Halopelagius fulvigenes]|uniref:Uncharacterized protein n=1 Tax=Halopelagius fulvigenes TaxID=1198324 RepID=A0ABD5U1R7_9EURY
MPDRPRYDQSRYDNTNYSLPGGGSDGGAPDSVLAPWHIGSVRVDGLSAENGVPPITPGASATYRVAMWPQPDDEIADHVERYRALKQYGRRAPGVVVYQTPEVDCYFREQQAGASNLVRIRPLAADAPATTATGELPPTRDSVHDPRWAVVTGVSDGTSLPERQCTLEIETTTIASTAEFPTRQAVIAARRRNSL